MAGKGSAPGERRGGRKKGVPNVKTRELIEILEAANFCPVAKLIETYELAEKEYERAEEIHDAIQDERANRRLPPINGTDAPAYLKLMQGSAAELMNYVYPRRKAVELSAADGKGVSISFVQLVKTIADDGSGIKNGS